MADERTVLIIDDNPDALEILRSFLEEKGYRVLTAADGPQGIELARDRAPDCVILDIMMPEMSGFQVCRSLKSLPRCEHIPIVMLTARKIDRDVSYARTVGADDFLTKPVRPAQLLGVLDKHIGGGPRAAARQLGRRQLLAVTTDKALLRALTGAVDAHNFKRQAADRYDLVDVTNSSEARAAIGRHRPSVVIVDARARNEGADQIVRKLKADPKHKTIPVLVARHEKSDELKFARADARLPGRPGGKAIIAAVSSLVEG
jgi:CheY-like chemotaxis protein